MATRKGREAQIAWNGPSWRLRIHQLTLADGSVVKRGAIEHPGSVVLVPLRDSHAGFEVLMLRQYRFAIGETILELPAGTRAWDENWLACAQRELREETGFRAERFTLLRELWPVPGLSDELMKLYLATGLHLDPLPAELDEELEVQPTLLTELVAMAQGGRLRDGKSIVGVLSAAVHLNL